MDGNRQVLKAKVDSRIKVKDQWFKDGDSIPEFKQRISEVVRFSLFLDLRFLCIGFKSTIIQKWLDMDCIDLVIHM